MPVIMIHTLELLEEQKRDIARKYTQILSRATHVPEERIYVFFAGYPLEGIAAGGVLNSDVPREALDQFRTKLTGRTNGSVSIQQNAVLGDHELQAGLRGLNADFGELCINASGPAWGTPLIDQKTKVLIAIAVDVVEQIHGKPFENHMQMAIKQGITRQEIEELLLFMTIYAGFNKAGAYYNEVTHFFDSPPERAAHG